VPEGHAPDTVRIARPGEDLLGHACQIAPLVRTCLLIAHVINCERRSVATSNESSLQEIRHLITGRLDGLEFEALSPRYPASEVLDGADREIDGLQTSIDLMVSVHHG
jgi:hypothetical protein